MNYNKLHETHGGLPTDCTTPHTVNHLKTEFNNVNPVHVSCDKVKSHSAALCVLKLPCAREHCGRQPASKNPRHKLQSCLNQTISLKYQHILSFHIFVHGYFTRYMSIYWRRYTTDRPLCTSLGCLHVKQEEQLWSSWRGNNDITNYCCLVAAITSKPVIVQHICCYSGLADITPNENNK